MPQHFRESLRDGAGSDRRNRVDAANCIGDLALKAAFVETRIVERDREAPQADEEKSWPRGTL